MSLPDLRLLFGPDLRHVERLGGRIASFFHGEGNHVALIGEYSYPAIVIGNDSLLVSWTRNRTEIAFARVRA
ncbi:MAG: hypothetical protein Q8M76_13890 [Spirochaetaceae bacterium]|nr:hypothetical protein [Spirochaetaceae bacterium]